MPAIRRIVASSIALASVAALASCSGGNGSAASVSDPASLTSLSVDGFTLAPAFSPSIHDYTIACGSGVNNATVRASPASGAIATLALPTALDLSAPRDVALSENDAIVIKTSNGSFNGEYWVRCLPHDFPPLVVRRYGPTTPGYYLLGNTVLGSGSGGYAMVLDANGTPVWYASTGSSGAGYTALVGPSTLAIMKTDGGRFGTNPNGHFELLSLATGTIATVKAVGGATDEHEILPMPNGHYMLLSYPVTNGIDLSSRNVSTTSIVDCNMQEVDATGALVWSWLGSDHFDAASESTELTPGAVDGVAIVDPFHCNSIALTPDGDILLSARQLDAMFLVSRATGKLLYKIGGVGENKDGALAIALDDDDESSFYHQHDARMLDDGHITLFDDHSPQPGDARGLEIAIDTTEGTAAVVWQAKASSGSQAMGSMRRQADGSSVIGWGLMGSSAPTLAFTEVDANGEPLLDVSFANGDHAYRVVKVTTGDLDIALLRKNASVVAQ